MPAPAVAMLTSSASNASPRPFFGAAGWCSSGASCATTGLVFVLIFGLFFFSHGVAPGFVSTNGKWLRFAGFRWLFGEDGLLKALLLRVLRHPCADGRDTGAVF